MTKTAKRAYAMHVNMHIRVCTYIYEAYTGTCTILNVLLKPNLFLLFRLVSKGEERKKQEKENSKINQVLYVLYEYLVFTSLHVTTWVCIK